MRLFFHPLVARAEFSDRSWSSKGAFVDAAADEVVASSPVATAHIHRRSRKRKPRLLCRRCARSFGVPSILVISMYAYLIWITYGNNRFLHTDPNYDIFEINSSSDDFKRQLLPQRFCIYAIFCMIKIGKIVKIGVLWINAIYRNFLFWCVLRSFNRYFLRTTFFLKEFEGFWSGEKMLDASFGG